MNRTNFSALIVVACALLLSLAPLVTATPFTRSETPISVTQASNLLTVQGDLSFSDVIPTNAYHRTVFVSWNVPSDALKGIDAHHLTLYGRIRPNNDASWLTFSLDPKAGPELTFTLECEVTGPAGSESCDAQKSILTRQIGVTLLPAQDAVFPHADGAVVEAAFEPFAPTRVDTLYDRLTTLEGARDALAAKVQGNPQHESLLILPDGYLSQARAAIHDGVLDTADERLQRADASLQNAQLSLAAQPVASAPVQVTREPDATTGLFSSLPSWTTAGLLVAALAIVAFLFAGRRASKLNYDEAFADDTLETKQTEPDASKLTRAPQGVDYLKRADYYKHRF